MTKEEKALILAMSIGDGYVRQISKKSGELTLCHGSKQQEYLTVKATLLSNILKRPLKIRHVYRKDGSDRYISTFTHHYLKFVHKALYKNGKKTLTYPALKRLTDAGFAMWYMDDGTIKHTKIKTKTHEIIKRKPPTKFRIKSWSAEICTFVPYDQIQVCIRIFQEKYGVTPKIRKSKKKDGTDAYSLRFNTGDLRILLPKWKQYAPPSMLYKFPDLITSYVTF